jgi:hypothetical protein
MIDANTTIVLVVAIMAVAVVAENCLKRLCRHEWEDAGEVIVERLVNDYGDRWTERRVPVRCKRCGKHAAQEI